MAGLDPTTMGLESYVITFLLGSVMALVLALALIGIARNEPLNIDINLLGVHLYFGGKQKASPSGCSQCHAEQKKKA